MIVVGIEVVVFGCEDFVDVVFYCLWCVYLLVGYLVDYYVGLEEFVYFCWDVIVIVDEGLVQVEVMVVQMGQGGFVQGLVEVIVGMGEMFFVVEQENVFYGVLYMLELQWRCLLILG